MTCDDVQGGHTRFATVRASKIPGVPILTDMQSTASTKVLESLARRIPLCSVSGLHCRATTSVGCRSCSATVQSLTISGSACFLASPGLALSDGAATLSRMLHVSLLKPSAFLQGSPEVHINAGHEHQVKRSSAIFTDLSLGCYHARNRPSNSASNAAEQSPSLVQAMSEKHLMAW